MREALLDVLFASGSDLLILPIQDVFGWFDRINIPATVGEHNWTWRLPAPVDRLSEERFAGEAADFCAGLASAGQRAKGKGQR